MYALGFNGWVRSRASPTSFNNHFLVKAIFISFTFINYYSECKLNFKKLVVANDIENNKLARFLFWVQISLLYEIFILIRQSVDGRTPLGIGSQQYMHNTPIDFRYLISSMIWFLLIYSMMFKGVELKSYNCCYMLR